MVADKFQLPSKTWFVQYDPNKGWGFTADGVFVSAVQSNNFVPFLPILELEWSAAQKLIAERTLPGEVSFPFSELLAFALQSQSQHWASLAATWVINGFPVSSKISEALVASKINLAIPQNLRHDLKKLLLRANRVA